LIAPQPKKQEKEETKKGSKGDKDGDKDEKPAEPERKFDRNDAEQAILDSCAFDEDQLGYIDFLECFIHLAKVYPFKPEEVDNINSFENKVEWFIRKIKEKFGELEGQFRDKTDLNYQPCVVVDEYEDDEDMG